MTTIPPSPIKPDYYTSAEECIASSRDNKQTNSRYPEFRQGIFHAGDEEQFQHYRDATNSSLCTRNIQCPNNVFAEDPPQPIWTGFTDIQASAVVRTYRYMTKFKKAIFVKIVDNKLRVFLPFSVADYTNEWGNQIRADPSRFSSIEEFLRHASDMEGRKYRIRFLKAADTWYANNCLVRYDESEGDTNVANLHNFMEELCNERELPDIEFFINRRDFPVMTLDGTEPYHHMFGGRIPLLSHSHSKYAPIFSMCKTDQFADILMPCWEDWVRVQSYDGKFIPRECRSYIHTFDTPWKDKLPTAIFRGSSTGCGVTVDTNQRLKLAQISSTTSPDENGVPYLDAGITKWNARPRKLENSPYLQTIEVDKLSFGLASRMSPEEQSKYKYIVDVDGHVSAYRLSLEMSMGSVILLVESDWKIWYHNKLIPYVHYVPVKRDLTDILDRIKWCRANDSECEQIATNALEFFQKYLRRDGVLDYMQKAILDTKQAAGTYLYNETTVLDAQYEHELSKLIRAKYHPPTEKDASSIGSLPPSAHTQGFFEGLSWLIALSGLPNLETDKRVFEYAGVQLYGRTSQDRWSQRRIIHGAFIASLCLGQLPSRPPNFCSCLGYHGNTAVYEYVKEMTLQDYIHSPQFNSKTLLLILIQVLLALQVAQNGCAFIHWDLRPANIILRRLPYPTTWDYVIEDNNIVRVKNTYLPIIVSFENAHAIHSSCHHGMIDMFSSNPAQDPVSLLLTCLREMMVNRREQLSKPDFSDAMRMMNIFAGTPLRDETFPNAATAKTFLRNHVRRYPPLVDPEKTWKIKDNMRPIDMVKMLNSIGGRLSIGKVSRTKTPIDSVPTQVFEFALAKSDEERIASYMNAFTQVRTCKLPLKGNLFSVYYAAQLTDHRLEWLREGLIDYLMSIKIDPKKYEAEVRTSIDSVRSAFQQVIDTVKPSALQVNIYESTSIIPCPYSEDTFLEPNTIIQLIKSFKSPLTNLAPYRQIALHVLLDDGRFSMRGTYADFYRNNLTSLLNSDGVALANNASASSTLVYLAGSIFSQDLVWLENKLEKEPKTCDEAIQYLNYYKNILDSLK